MKKEQFSKCIEVCNQILTQLPSDLDALKVKLSSLVALDKIQEALEMCKDIEGLSFEKAYCLYRLNKVLLRYTTCSLGSSHFVNTVSVSSWRKLFKYAPPSASQRPSMLSTFRLKRYGIEQHLMAIFLL